MDAANSGNHAQVSSDREIYERVCRGNDPIAIGYYLATADPEDANHGIAAYINSLEAEVARLRRTLQSIADEDPSKGDDIVFWAENVLKKGLVDAS